MAKDGRAEVEAMYENAGNGLKGTYIGYSTGAHQWLVALAQSENEIIQWIDNTILIGTVYAGNLEEERYLLEEPMSLIGYLRRDLDIYSIGGLNWAEDYAKICEVDQFTCDIYSIYEAVGGPNPHSTKSLDHFD